MTSIASAPLPDPHDRGLAPYWEGAAHGELLLQTCTNCGYRTWPPAHWCAECLATDQQWLPATGHGRIWSVAVYDRALDQRLAADIPYAVVLVVLDEGPAMIGRFVGEPAAAVPDAPVRAVFTEIGDGLRRVDWVLDGMQALPY